jgi:DNA-binding MarR family transcriptional regulator
VSTPAPEPAPSRAELIERLTTAVRRQVAWTVLHNQAIADRLGLGITDLHCTNLLAIEGPMTAGRLAVLMGITTGAVTGVLDRLERAGMVRREPDPADRRRVIARLVPEGMERVAAEYAAIAAAVATLYAGYDEGQLALLTDYATRSAELTQAITARLRSEVEPPGEYTDGLSAPLGETTAGRLVLVGNLSRFRIRAASGMAELFRARFDRRTPRVVVHDGTVTMTFPGLFSPGVGRGEMLLNGAISWEVELQGGASTVDADLAATRVTGFSLTGGASNVGVRLPRPEGTVPLRVSGGASRVTLLRPAGVPFRIRVNGGLSRLSIDGRQLGSTGGPATLDSPGYERAVDRYELEVSGGASRITVRAV